MAFPEHLRDVATRAVGSIDARDAAGVSALSFFVEYEDDAPRRPVLTIGHNTEARIRARTPDASGEAEARWNYAFWIQNRLAVVGDLAGDPAGAAARRAWISDLGLWYEEPADSVDLTRAFGLAARIEELRPSLLPSRPYPARDRRRRAGRRQARAGARPRA